ncbi:hypothetical protein BV20DRAFT_655195 [Pilatotrama ljubarskyi]|nr:hypothetical protein BV20DRAFT_655195 [Pilatotrama ljubarskyi]
MTFTTPPLVSRVLSLAFFLPPLSLDVRAQKSNATCFPGYEWMNNAMHQSPCTVASFLLSPCTSDPAATTIPALAGSRSLYNFAGTSLDDTPCVCNTVTFAMLYACATCQGAEAAVLPWYVTSENCTARYLASYPDDIPPGTSVPAWAYDREIQASGHLDINTAHEIAKISEPDRTISGSYDGPEPTSTGGFTPIPHDESFDDSDDSPSTGVIVGAAVGGSVGATLAVAAVVLFLRRRSRRRRQYMPAVAHDSPNISPTQGMPSVEKTSGESVVKLYNPDDPSTYPGVVSPTAVSAGSTLVPRSSGLQDYSLPPWDKANAESNHRARFQGAAAASYAGRPEV